MADISAILAELDDYPDSAASKAADLQLLTRAWTNERLSPTLLPYPHEVLERTNDQIRKKIEELEESTYTLADAAQSQAAGYPTAGPVIGSTGSLARIIQETALNRTRFIVRSLLRTRLDKICNQSPFLLALAGDDASRLESLLSKEEETFMRARWGLLRLHLQDICLDSLPSQFRALDDTSGSGPDMRGTGLPEEHELCSVIVRVLRVTESDSTAPASVMDGQPHDTAALVVHGIDRDELITLKAGDCWLVRWGDVKARIESGSMELI